MVTGLSLLFLLFLLLTYTLWFASRFTRSACRQIAIPPSGLGVEPIIVQNDRSRIAGWIVDGARGGGIALLLHGIRDDRTFMLSRALFLNRLGFTVVLIDLPAHGESEGETISFGHYEGGGVAAVVAYLKARYSHERIGVIGESLGAASIVLSGCANEIHAIVLESMYTTIERAIACRLRNKFGALGLLLFPLLLAMLRLRVKVHPSQLRPASKMSSIQVPMMIVGGEEDHLSTPEENQELFSHANEPKELWLVKGAGHTNYHHFCPQTYEAKVGNFLLQHLRAI